MWREDQRWSDWPQATYGLKVFAEIPFHLEWSCSSEEKIYRLKQLLENKIRWLHKLVKKQIALLGPPLKKAMISNDRLLVCRIFIQCHELFSFLWTLIRLLTTQVRDSPVDKPSPPPDFEPEF